ncbi:MAG: DegT/DnrJ/EryC1/StrS family aminotransferase [Gammaproteobacteria bacterium]|nr:DegT/DnrJ/EryC1/StrS family aminotransferase [Gammaproteobacteria bacterium]
MLGSEFMGVPFFTLDRQHSLIRESLLESITQVVDSGMFILGNQVAELEGALAVYLGVSDVVTVSSGTEALRLSLLMRGIGAGDEVITVSNSYFATAAAIAMVGARPVFVDIDPKTMLIDTSKLHSALTGRTRAVIPVHYNGYPCDQDVLYDFTQSNGISLIEDCAQSFGSSYKGEHVGVRDVGCFSLHPLKVLGALGDAGFVSLTSMQEAKFLRELRNNGLLNRDKVSHICGNSRMDTIQAAVILVKMKHIDNWLVRRREIGSYYLNNIRGIELPSVSDDVEFNFSSFVVRSNNRNKVQAALQSYNVESKIQYPIAIHQQSPYSQYITTSLPRTEEAVASMLSLPLSQHLTDVEVEYTVDCVNRVVTS